MKLTRFLPNFVTTLRIVLCPISIWLALRSQLAAAFAVFVAGSLTDFLDGYLARRLNARSALGALLDPVCDKVYLVAFFTLFMILGICPPWFLGLVISVNLLQWIGFAYLNLPSPLSKLRFESLKIGKWNVALQLVWVGALLLNLWVGIKILSNSWLVLGVFGCLASLQTAVFFSYFFRFRRSLTADLRALFPAHP